MAKGSLVFVGTGYRLAAHITLEAKAHIEQAEKLLYVVGDPLFAQWLRQKNPTAESLEDCYAPGKPRTRTYREMVARILGHVRRGARVVAAFYGHPGVLVDATHSAIRIARREGYEARVLPGLSAEDCLFAELRIDPSAQGWQSYEASDFLYRRPRFDPSSALVLWQVGVIYEESITDTTNPQGIRDLVRVLRRFYPSTHRVVVYHTSPYPVCDSVIRRVRLDRLSATGIPTAATLYVPPRRN